MHQWPCAIHGVGTKDHVRVRPYARYNEAKDAAQVPNQGRSIQSLHIVEDVEDGAAHEAERDDTTINGAIGPIPRACFELSQGPEAEQHGAEQVRPNVDALIVQVKARLDATPDRCLGAIASQEQ